MNHTIPVAVLGATGTVGQKFITLLQDHPWFHITELVASERSAGKPYGQAVTWQQDIPIPDTVRDMTILPSGHNLDSTLLFSGMDASVAGPIEEAYARSGHTVVSNARNHRMDPLVPIIIPEINPDHFELTKKQNWSGAIITNCNCVIMPVAMVLAPLHQHFDIEWVNLTSMQAVSGAGYPGVPSLDIMGNVIPYIAGEEEKVETEGLKILGTLTEQGINFADITLSAQCNRVPVIDGHMSALSIRFRKPSTAGQVSKVLEEWEAMPQRDKLPTAADKPVIVLKQNDRPQPRRDLWVGKGMSAVVGRIRPCSIGHVKMMVLGHNTVRGAAGAAILNAEAYVHLNYLA